MKRKRLKLFVIGICLLIAGVVFAQGLIKGFDRGNRRTVAVNVDAFGNLFLSSMSASSDDDCTTCCAALTNASVNHNVTGGHYYTVTANGNTAYLLCGAAPTATTAVNGHFTVIPAGQSRKIRLTGPICAHIATVTAGSICFEHHVPTP